jgi:hypothetical protein
MASGSTFAGPVFLTGHDPDFHAQPGAGSPGAQDLLRSGLSFVTGGTYNDANLLTKKFLWVESAMGTPGGPAVPGGHLRGENGLIAIGLNSTLHYDWVSASGLASLNFANYSAIAIASSFGGTLGRAELDGLIARKTDIEAFINSGGGLFASAECFPCQANLLAGPTAPNLFGYLPVTVTSIGTNPPFTVTPAGAGAPFFLTNADVNDPTHNSFGLTGGLQVLDIDRLGNAATLAGIVTVQDGGFVPVPTPGSLILLLGALGVLTLRRAAPRGA